MLITNSNKRMGNPLSPSRGQRSAESGSARPRARPDPGVGPTGPADADGVPVGSFTADTHCGHTDLQSCGGGTWRRDAGRRGVQSTGAVTGDISRLVKAGRSASAAPGRPAAAPGGREGGWPCREAGDAGPLECQLSQRPWGPAGPPCLPETPCASSRDKYLASPPPRTRPNVVRHSRLSLCEGFAFVWDSPRSLGLITAESPRRSCGCPLTPGA